MKYSYLQLFQGSASIICENAISMHVEENRARFLDPFSIAPRVPPVIMTSIDPNMAKVLIRLNGRISGTCKLANSSLLRSNHKGSRFAAFFHSIG